MLAISRMLPLLSADCAYKKMHLKIVSNLWGALQSRGICLFFFVGAFPGSCKTDAAPDNDNQGDNAYDDSILRHNSFP